jgi:hypothetical protein
VIGGLSEKATWARSFSIFKFFKPQEVLEGRLNPSGAITVLAAGSAIFLALSLKIFEDRDLAI